MVDEDGAKVELVDDDAHESEGAATATAIPNSDNAAPSRTPAFSSIGSPTVPTPESLQAARPGEKEEEASKAK